MSRPLVAALTFALPLALFFACAQPAQPAKRRAAAAAAYPNPTVDALATTSGTSGTFVVPSGAYVTSWWAHAAAGGAGGTVTIAPSGPGSYATCYVSDASTCRDAGPSITIPAGVAFTLEIPTLKGGTDELGAGSVFVFAGTDTYAVTVNGPAGSADAAAPPTDAGASDAADAGPAPTLSALAGPLYRSASGGGLAIPLAGANLTSGCTAVVNGVSATVTCSGTTASVTPPAMTTLTSGNIAITTPGGTATLSTATCTGCKPISALPPHITHFWHAGESTGTSFVDTVGFAPLTNAGSPNVPFSSNWQNGQPGFVPTVSATNGEYMTADAGTQAQPDSVFVAMLSNNPTLPSYEFDGVTARQVMATTITSESVFNIYGGSFSSPITFTGTSAVHWYEFVFNTTCVLIQDNGTPQTAAGCGSNALGGFTAFNNVLGNASAVGPAGVFAIYNGTPTSGERTALYQWFLGGGGTSGPEY